jgi:hypothetical protein
MRRNLGQTRAGEAGWLPRAQRFAQRRRAAAVFTAQRRLERRDFGGIGDPCGNLAVDGAPRDVVSYGLALLLEQIEKPEGQVDEVGLQDA